jgi:DNA primase catalytic core
MAGRTSKPSFEDYTDPELQQAGLVIKNEQGRLYDRFRDRVMFPIINQKGEVIAFGGRVLDEGEPKYLNSPETPLFEKGRELFGLPQARAALREKNTAIVVEGYMDVVALAQHGVGNAVATLGTATTPTHVQKLLRQVDRIVFCFDGDNGWPQGSLARAGEQPGRHCLTRRASASCFCRKRTTPTVMCASSARTPSLAWWRRPPRSLISCCANSAATAT